jgi:hypothetical protein
MGFLPWTDLFPLATGEFGGAHGAAAARAMRALKIALMRWISNV